jgi:hypothetical protein
MHGHNNSQGWIDERTYSMPPPDVLVTSSGRRLVDLAQPTNRFCPIHTCTSLYGHLRNGIQHGVIPPRESAPRGFSLSWLQGKESCTRTSIMAAIASTGACIIVVREESVSGPRFLDLIFRPEFAFNSCSIMEKFAFHKSSVEWEGALLRIQPAEYSLTSSPRKRPRS